MARIAYEGTPVSGGRTSGETEVPDGANRSTALRALARDLLGSVSPLARITGIQYPSRFGDNTYEPVSKADSDRAVQAAVADQAAPLASRAYVAAAAGFGRPQGVNEAQWAAAQEGVAVTSGRTAASASSAGTGNS